MSYELNISECTKCLKSRGIKCQGVCPCPVDADKKSIIDHAGFAYCPEKRFNKFTDRPKDWESAKYTHFSDPINLERRYTISHAAERAMWKELHLRPLTYKPASELWWLTEFSQRLKCGSCRDHWNKLLIDYPPDLSSAAAYFRWTVFTHNIVNRLLGKSEISCAKASRIFGVTHLLDKRELIEDTSKIKLLIYINWSLGDEVVLTSAIRDLLAAYPNEYEISLNCKFPDVFTNLGINTTPEPHPDIIHIFKINWAQYRHFIDYARQDLEESICRPVHQGRLKGHFIFSEEEKELPVKIIGPFWIMAAGFKMDATVKGYRKEDWQAIVDHYAGKIQFVQVGGTGLEHVEQHLKGTVDLTGKTTARELIRLIGSPYCMGIISGITAPMHIGAAFEKPLVVLAGSREHDWVSRYPDSEWIRTTCEFQGCWKLRAVPFADLKLPTADPYPQFNRSICQHPDGTFASCMTAISPARVIQGVDRFLVSTPSSLPTGHSGRRSILGVCSYVDEGFGTWGAILTQTTAKYAKEHGYGFTQPKIPYPTGDDRQPHWQKAEILLRELIHYDYLCWIDGDVIIIKPEFNLLALIKDQLPADLYINRDVNGLCNGIMIWRNTLASHRFIKKWRDSGRKGFCDQVAMVKLLAGERDVVIRELPQRSINAFWWLPSDFLIHFGGKKFLAEHIWAFIHEYAQPVPLPPPKAGKRAILVLGVESSGTRLWLRHLLACGVQGDDSHNQPFDLSFEGTGDMIVWRQSFPMGDLQPDTDKMLKRLKEAGYTDIRAFWCWRNKECCIKSMLKEGHAKTKQEAIRDIEEGLIRIGKFVRDASIPTRIVTYERLISEPDYRQDLLELFGLSAIESLPVLRDENEKWLLVT